jgi:hypothetical protein
MRMHSRRAGLLIAALLSGAASPGPYAPLAYADPAPQPATPPTATASAFTPAPMPDPDLDPNSFRHTQPARVELTPSLFHERQSFHGDGYTPNSSVEGEQTRKIRPAPGFNLSVPLE